MSSSTASPSRIIVKATLGQVGSGVTKHLALHTPSLTLADLCSAVHALFRQSEAGSGLLSASTTNLILRYVDADGDPIHLDTDADLSLALDLATDPKTPHTILLRLLVSDKLNCPLPATLLNEINTKGLSLAGRNVTSLHASLVHVRSLLDTVLDALAKAKDKDRNVKPLDSDDIANLLSSTSLSATAAANQDASVAAAATASPVMTGAATPTPASPAHRPTSSLAHQQPTNTTQPSAYPPQQQQQQQQQATAAANAYPGYPPTSAAATSTSGSSSAAYPATAQPQQPQYTGQQYMQQPPSQYAGQQQQYPPTQPQPQQQQQQQPSYPGYPPSSASGPTQAYARYPQAQPSSAAATGTAPQQAQMPTGGSTSGQQQPPPPMGYPGYSVPTPATAQSATASGAGAYGMPGSAAAPGYPGYASAPGYPQQQQQQQPGQQMPGYAVPPTYGKPY